MGARAERGEWAAEWAISASTLAAKLASGRSLDESLTGARRIKPKNANQAPLTVGDETKPHSVWAAEIGISDDTLAKRLSSCGWDPLKAVTTPVAKTNRVRDARYRIPAGEPGSWSWPELPFERDVYAQAFVRVHPDGASMEQIGEVMGVKVSWVCEIEQNALTKLRKLVDDGEITERELVAAFDVLLEHAPPEQTLKQARAAWRPSLPPAGPMNGDELSTWLRDGPTPSEPTEPVERWQDVPEVPEDYPSDDDEQVSGTWPTSLAGAPEPEHAWPSRRQHRTG